VTHAKAQRRKEARTTMHNRDQFQNVAGMGSRDHAGVDAILESELRTAGISIITIPEFARKHNGEPQSCITGGLHQWSFQRAWCYWIAKGPGIPPSDAELLHAKNGNEVRVDGHCGCPSPIEWFHGFAVGRYHVDTQAGLCALADLIRAIYRRTDAPTPAMIKADRAARK
jgi:hypothetical protein